MADATRFGIWFRQQWSEQHAVETVVTEDGEVSVVNWYSAYGSPIRELGQYHVRLGEDDPQLQRVNELIARQRLDREPAAEAPMLHASCRKILSVRSGDRAVDHSYPSRGEIPERLAAFEEEMAALQRTMLAHPLRTVTVEPVFASASVRPGDDWPVTVRFTNRGSQRTSFGNPAAFAGQAGPAFRVDVWVNQDPFADDVDPDPRKAMIELPEHELRTAPLDVLPSTERLLSLDPGQSVEARVDLRFPGCPEGEYVAELVYMFFRTPEEMRKGNVVGGEFFSDPVALRVEPPAEG